MEKKTIAAYKAARTRLLKQAENASFAVRRTILREVAVYDRTINALQALI